MEAVEKRPPHNLEAEASILGAVLFDKEVLPDVVETLNPGSFYLPAHQKIFQVMKDLFDRSQAVDIITVSEGLKKTGSYEAVGGGSFLTSLADMVETSAHVSEYVEIVREKALLRTLITNASQIVQDALKPDIELDGLLDRAENAIFDISQRNLDNRAMPVREIIKDSIEAIDQLYQRKEYVTGIASGFLDFDRMTSGLHPAELVIVAGRPSMGKSAFVTCLCEHVALEVAKPVVIFSLEMSKEQMVQRMLCSQARVDAQKVRSGFLAHTDWPKLTSAAGRLSNAPIFIDDTAGLTIFELRARARRLKMQQDIQLVVVDYLQLMQGGARIENRQQEISEISRRLKAMARELSVPVIAISQLSRAVESRTGNRPQLSDLRESGSLEQDADLVVLLFREEYYHQTEENRGRATAIIAKQRNGPVGDCDLVFVKEFTRFENLSKEVGTVVY